MTSELIISENLDSADCRELGSEAVFTISSAKPGNGVEQLRDNNLDTYWQSDGSFPHSISVSFLRKVSIRKLCFYMDYGLDESYTPKKIAISCGTSLHDLLDVASFELNEPVGWVTVNLIDPCCASKDSQGNAIQSDFNNDSTCLRTHLLQIKILSMHQNGRDTHVRQLKLFGPRESPEVMANFKYSNFKTVDMQQYALIR